LCAFESREQPFQNVPILILIAAHRPTQFFLFCFQCRSNLDNGVETKKVQRWQIATQIARSDRGAGFPVTTGGGGLTVILASFQIAAGERQLKILSGKGRVRTQPLARSKEPPATGGHGLAAAAASDSESESD
jgi:hypothetical protein